MLYENAVVQDSMLMTCTSLKNMIKMLGLQNELAKGFYPYEMTDLNYEGPCPDKSMFSLNNFDVGELREFEKWYERKN